MNMLSNRERNANKSKGPWGMKSFNFTYRKMGEEMHRHRFVSAPNERGARKQFNTLMDKDHVKVEILEIVEVKRHKK